MFILIQILVLVPLPILFLILFLIRFALGWSGRVASGDGGDQGQLPGGGGVPAPGTAQGSGPLQQELPDPSVPPAQGWTEEPACSSDWTRGWRASARSGAGPQGAFFRANVWGLNISFDI